MDVRQDTEFLGRGEELYQLIRNLVRGRHTLITGPKGIGKTRLMQESIAVLQGTKKHIGLSVRLTNRLKGNLGMRISPGQYRIIFVTRSSPLGDCMREIAEWLYGMNCLRLGTIAPAAGDWASVRKQLTGLGSVRVQEIIVESIRQQSPPVLLYFDSLDRIAPSSQLFLEELLASAVICAAAVHPKTAFHFRKIWSSFSRIELGGFNEETAGQLIRHCVEIAGMRVVDPELYTREILKSANGNPFQINNLIWHGSREAHLTSDEIRKVRRTEEGELFNMGPIYILLASVLTLFKIFSFGTDNREFYIYFSALGFIVYLTFRVFRTFFLFKPQRFNS